MTGLISSAHWLPFLAELAAKATVVLLLTAGVAGLLWRSSAATRHLVWCVGIVGVLALPVFSVMLPAWELPLLPAREGPAPATPELSLDHSVVKAEPAPPSAAPPVVIVPGAGGSAWLPRIAAGLLLTGVGAGLLWLALGFWGVARLGRRAEVVRDPEWLRTSHEASEQLGLRRPVLLLRSRGSVMPATGGLLWPVIVVPDVAEQWTDDRRRAVLAHELAHVKRFDCLTQALAQVACALFWWHPAVWYAARRLRVERERACDDLVLRAGTRPSDYAAHLLEIARSHRGMRLATPALVSMARPSHLESRLLWVLDAARARGVPSARATVLSLLLALLAAGSLSAMRPISADNEAAKLSARGPSAEEVGEPEDEEDGKKDEHEDRKDHAIDPAKDGSETGASVTLNAQARVRAGADTFPEVEDLIAMRAVGVDAAYIAEMRGAGLGRVTTKQLIAMRANGVTARYAQEMNAAGLGPLGADQVISLRALGVTPAFLADLRRQGYTNLTAEQVSGMQAVGVDAEFIRGMASVGYDDIPAARLTGLRAVGVTPQYVRDLARHGLNDVSPALLEGMRAVGVTGDYIEGLRAAGLTGLGAPTLTGLRAVGVDGAYIRELEGVGLTGLTADQLTTLRANHITAAYVRELRAAGFATLTPNQLVQLKNSGVDRELIESRIRVNENRNESSESRNRVRESQNREP